MYVSALSDVREITKADLSSAIRNGLISISPRMTTSRSRRIHHGKLGCSRGQAGGRPYGFNFPMAATGRWVNREPFFQAGSTEARGRPAKKKTHWLDSPGENIEPDKVWADR